MNPYNLSELLQEVNLHLEKGTSMLTGLNIEDMYIYYAVAKVHATAASRNNRLFIDIPLRAADRSFMLYETHSLPFFHKGIQQFMKIDEPFVYLAVTKDQQFFTILTTERLAKCTTDFYTICPSNMVLRKSNEENCLIALFTGKTEVAMKKSRRVLLREFVPVWIRSPDAKYWVYSKEKSTHITLKCRPLGGSPLDEDETADIWLNGYGILPNTSTWYAETFKLLPLSLGRSVVGLNKTYVLLQSIETIIKPNEQELLQNRLNSSVHLQEIDDVVKGIIGSKDRTELGVTPVLGNLRQEELTPSTTHNPNGGEPEEAGMELPATEREPTPFVSCPEDGSRHSEFTYGTGVKPAIRLHTGEGPLDEVVRMTVAVRFQRHPGPGTAG
ncbi:hypothetical protein B7P43_G14084 [Cryptotermes secundus]|uniref:Uncharacterized protein n=1 Tax=Cryptotermes secundus TaxID=105785 RepID=A0A2J7QRL1_9NEOP|nr:uncharacterized protein LOC111865838 [Cryptotermes secundus]PNF31232.1 hypothetical protein B7P43_G14084 [Cryptotermes secundus]